MMRSGAGSYLSPGGSRGGRGPFQDRFQNPFQEKLRASAPLIFRTLIDLVKIMEEASLECRGCGPDLWGATREVRRSLLDGLIAAELDELGIRACEEEDRIGK